ncbi:SURF1 family protein [Aestuariimicrobium sp. p3-SID1156]|uniref:SURF1 family protein n=1 Tax=Aestuariimicrobium sp. p3-SID1156 TaxID=2916038 RepID=UPI00223BD792|nr:SURF1 family protein [Aestuariimicrobium sp. p3-SID1156]MCT1458047.1 SURF1 family protein [Aestuariimicrobium sp. p3-SID1156]
MVRLKRLLVLLVGVIIATIMVFLGLWQANTFRTQGAQANEERAALAPVPLPSKAHGTQVAELYGRQVTLTGEYLPEYQYYVGTKPPLSVVTAFRAKDGTVVAIVRGQVTSRETPSSPPTGVVTQTGLLMPSQKDVTGDPSPGLPTPRIPQVRLERLAQEWPAPLLNGYLTLGAEDATAQSLTPSQVVLPEGEGHQRNAGYALQWWVFAVFALIMTFIWARSIKDPGLPQAPENTHETPG